MVSRPFGILILLVIIVVAVMLQMKVLIISPLLCLSVLTHYTFKGKQLTWLGPKKAQATFFAIASVMGVMLSLILFTEGAPLSAIGHQLKEWLWKGDSFGAHAALAAILALASTLFYDYFLSKGAQLKLSFGKEALMVFFLMIGFQVLITLQLPATGFYYAFSRNIDQGVLRFMVIEGLLLFAIYPLAFNRSEDAQALVSRKQ